MDKRPDDFFMTAHERQALVTLARDHRARRIVEIGVQEGHAARLLLDHVPSLEAYTGVDVLPGFRSSLPAQKDETPAEPGRLVKDDPRFALFLRERGSLDLTADFFGRDIDLFLIAGDHSRPAVRHDSALAWAATRPGGLIVWHDYWDGDLTGVHEVVDELIGEGHKISHVPETWLAVEVRGAKQKAAGAR